MFKQVLFCSVLFIGLGAQAQTEPAPAPSATPIQQPRMCKKTVGTHQIELPMLDAKSASQLSVIKADGSDVKVAASGCFEQQKPGLKHGIRYILCSFDLGKNERLQVYSYAQMVSGLVTPMSYVLWIGDRPLHGDFSSCL